MPPSATSRVLLIVTLVPTASSISLRGKKDAENSKGMNEFRTERPSLSVRTWNDCHDLASNNWLTVFIYMTIFQLEYSESIAAPTGRCFIMMHRLLLQSCSEITLILIYDLDTSYRAVELQQLINHPYSIPCHTRDMTDSQSEISLSPEISPIVVSFGVTCLGYGMLSDLDLVLRRIQVLQDVFWHSQLSPYSQCCELNSAFPIRCNHIK